MYRVKWPIIAVAIIGLAVSACCADDGRTTPASALLNSDNGWDWNAAFQTVLEERKDTVETLISVIKKKDVNPYYGGQMHKAVELLGMLRAKEAVGVLSKNLMYLPLTRTGGYVIDGGNYTEGYHVCAQALVDIGEPSIDNMLYKICMSRDVEERNVAAWVIMMIEGKDQALHRLDGLIKADSTIAKNKVRFQEARDYIANWKPDCRHPLSKKMEEEAAKKEKEKSQTPSASDKEDESPGAASPRRLPNQSRERSSSSTLSL